MRSIFEEVGLTWQGEEYTVPPDQVMGLIEVIEDAITIEEMAGVGVKRAKLARAYAAALRYAGARASHEQVFNSLFGTEGLRSTEQVIQGLMAMMIPPAHLSPVTTAKAAPGKKRAARRAPGASKPSKPRT